MKQKPLESYENQIILTGDRPTGPLHLGHYVGSLRSRVILQEKNTQFVMIADAQALTDHAENPEILQKYTLEIALDYLAVGIDPKKTTIFIQSQVPALFELTLFYLNLVSWNRLKHNPTVKAEILQKGFKDQVPAGFMIYPISQAADITAFQANLVPVGEDQIPMIEQTVEIVRKFNRIYQKEVLVEPEVVLSTSSRLPGIDGKAKMSKSLNNAIYLSESPESLQKKVKSMYTDPTHLHVEDPGQVEGNPVFSYLDAFDPDLKRVQDLKDHYQRGGLGDAKVKSHLLEVLQQFLVPVQKRRNEYAQDVSYVKKLLKEGSHHAAEFAAKTLLEVKKTMGISYSL